jgi:hypothetical protein
MPGIVGDLLKAMGPIMAATRENLNRFVDQMDLDAIAVELDLVAAVKKAAKKVGNSRKRVEKRLGRSRWPAGKERPRLDWIGCLERAHHIPRWSSTRFASLDSAAPW